MKDYSNAFTEAYAIINCLEEDSYKKIPKELLEVLEKNRNKEYEYIVENEEDLTEQPMLMETRAILFNIFRDYLATPEQKEKIIKMQAEERKQNEEKKRKEYYANKEVKADKKVELKGDVKEEIVDLITVKPKETMWNKIKNMLGSILKSKRNL